MLTLVKYLTCFVENIFFFKERTCISSGCVDGRGTARSLGGQKFLRYFAVKVKVITKGYEPVKYRKSRPMFDCVVVSVMHGLLRREVFRQCHFFQLNSPFTMKR